MKKLTGYIKDDLKVYISNQNHENTHFNENTMAPVTLNHYRFLVMFKGTAEIEYNRKKILISDGQMFFADINTLFSYSFNKFKDTCYLEMIVFPSVLSEKNDDIFFLRALQDMPDKKRVININSDEFTGVKSNLNSIIKCIKKSLGRAHILPRIRSIISELDMYYDEHYISDKRISDSIFINIRTYINHHYMENINYEFICRNFYVSKPTVIKMFKLNTNMTMHKYIEELRMNAANKMLTDGLDVVKVAAMCGYNNYSTFLSAYKKHYGVLPSENKKELHKNPLA